MTGTRPSFRRSNAVRTLRSVRSHYWLYVMLIAPIAFYFLFCYKPMGGVQIAFRNYNMFKGIWDSPWVGLRYFKQVFSFTAFWVSVRNMLTLNVIGLVLGFPAPILLALFLNEVTDRQFKKVTQTIMYLPHFISWVVVGGMMYQLFSSSGMINTIVKSITGSAVPFLSSNSWWIFTYFVVGLWKSIGWNAIIYLSAITGIDQSIYEAARVDGCSRFRMMFSITLPCILGTVMIMFILAVGGLMSIGFEQPYVMQNSVVMEVADVVSTYVYRVGIQQAKFSIGTAVGLAQSAINFLLVIGSNTLSRRITGESIW